MVEKQCYQVNGLRKKKKKFFFFFSLYINYQFIKVKNSLLYFFFIGQIYFEICKQKTPANCLNKAAFAPFKYLIEVNEKKKRLCLTLWVVK